MYHHQGFWNARDFHQGAILAQQRFKTARPADVLICSSPKTGTTWLKALAFAIVTRKNFDETSTPLLTTLPHDLIPILEKLDHKQIHENNPLVATHLPYSSLPESFHDSNNCKIVYIYRNAKDVIVSYYHYLREILNLPIEDASFVNAFDEFVQGFSYYGPYWDHILGYWKVSMERSPETIMFLKYEEMKREPSSNVKRLADFIGYPFSIEEMEAGVVESIVKLCSFENLSKSEVNRSGKHWLIDNGDAIDNRIYFRKCKDGDWKNYFTKEMEEKIDRLVDMKLRGTGLILK